MRLSPAELVAILNSALHATSSQGLPVEVLHTGTREICGAVIDSRVELREGVFVALVGARDGHHYRSVAIERGAAAILQAKGYDLPSGALEHDVTVLAVADPLAALTALASEVPRRHPGPAVALTGSNGKTTTRAMTSALLELEWPGRVLSTRGNLNNHLGVPLTLLGAPHEPAAYCIELGMSAAGENDALASIVCPNVGIVTSVALEHLEFMGSLSAIVDAELEVAARIRPGGALVIPGDDPDIAAALATMTKLHGGSLPFEVLRFGPASCDPDLSIEVVAHPERTQGVLKTRDGTTFALQLELFGAYNLRNAAAAILAALHVGVAPGSMAHALAKVEPVGDRGRVLLLATHTIVADCYNANPGSMTVALIALAEAVRESGRRSIAVLGDMLELGETQEALHVEVGEQVRRLGIEHLFVVGARGSWIAAGARGGATQVHDLGRIDSPDELTRAGGALRAHLEDGNASTVLLKASRGLKLERLIPLLVQLPAPSQSS